MLVTTLFTDRHGDLQRRLDRGSNRRVLAREVDLDLATGCQIVGVIIVNEAPREEMRPNLQAL